MILKKIGLQKIKIFTDELENDVEEQILEVAGSVLGKGAHIRIMPDVHKGKGCVIGYTSKITNYVCPNLVGVDIGCGVLCIELGKIDLDLEKLDDIISNNIPSGKEIRDKVIGEYDEIENLICIDNLKKIKNFDLSIGTLGGGNHFIEVDEDKEGNKYLVIHTGSRNLGNQVAKHYQDIALELCSDKEEYLDRKEEIITKYKEEGKQKELQRILKELSEEYKNKVPRVKPDMCYLTGKWKDMYLHDMKICQQYASINRYYIALEILKKYFNINKGIKLLMPNLRHYIDSNSVVFNAFESVHNYIDFKDNILRKGAISAHKGERVLIPMNMRDGVIIGIGKGNNDWNYSAPHGAGRIMSRNKAKEKISLNEFKESMKGIYSTSVVESTIDESPMAYKSPDDILKFIGDTIEIEKIIKPIYNFKAKE